MRLLADENFPRPIVELLRAAGHDVCGSNRLRRLEGLRLLDLAESTARILLTLDKDFWQIAVQRRVALAQSGVVLFESIPRPPAISSRWCGRLSRRIGPGPSTSASSPPMAFRCWLLAGADGSDARALSPRIERRSGGETERVFRFLSANY